MKSSRIQVYEIGLEISKVQCRTQAGIPIVIKLFQFNIGWKWPLRVVELSLIMLGIIA